MAAPKPVVHIEPQPTYVTEDEYRITFIPMGRTLPGVSYKVIVSRKGELVAKDWMSTQFRPNMRHAVYYYNKHVTKREPEDAEYWQGKATIHAERKLHNA